MSGGFLSKLAPTKGTGKNIIGLDVDDKSVKLLELKRTAKGFTVTNFAVTDIVPSQAGEDKIASISSTRRKTLDKLGIKDAEVFTAVSGPGVSIRRINIPVMPEEELHGAVKWEAKNLIPFPLNAVTLDYYVIGKIIDKGREKLDIIVVAAQDTIINKQISIIEAAGLKVSGITVNPFALWDILKRNISPKETEIIALIDIGAESASINLFKNNVLQFTREISVAGESITKSMTGVLISDQWQLSLTYDQAEKIKIEHGIPADDSQEKTTEGIPLSQIREVMRPTLRRLLNEILRSFDYYKEQFREPKINKVFLAGGSSRLKNLVEYLSTGFGIKVELVNPLEGIEISLNNREEIGDLRELAPRLTLALGLAVGQAESLNLVDVKRPASKAKEFGKFFESVKIPALTWMLGGIILFVAAFGFNFYMGRKVSFYREQLNNKRAILNDLRTLMERREIVNRISKEQTMLRETLSKFNSAIPSGITLTKLDYMNSARYIKINGIAPNIKSVGSFLTSLEDSPYFSRAHLIESRKGIGTDSSFMGFEMSFYVD